MSLLGHRIRPSIAFRPARDALNKTGLGRRDLLQSFLKLFPHSGHCEESSGTCPLKRCNKSALESVRSCEEEFANITHVLKNVKAETSDVRKRQIGDNPVLGSDRIGALTFHHTLNSYAFPAEIIVAEHASFGISCSSTRVNEATAFAGLLLVHLGDNYVFLNCYSCLEKIFPE